MKRTSMRVCVGKKNGYDVWRVVWICGDHYYVKWNNDIVNVDKDIKEHNFISSRL